MAGKKKTGKWDAGKFVEDDEDDAKKESDEDSDDEWKPKTGGSKEDKDGDEDDEDDDGPKLVRQPRTSNKLDLRERCKYYERKIRHLQL
jgi:hypothetical protein